MNAIKKIFKALTARLKNARGQGMIETEFVTIIFFTVSTLCIMDMTRVIMGELRAFEAVHMANRVAIVKGDPQLAVTTMLGLTNVMARVEVEKKNPTGQDYDNGNKVVTLRLYWKQALLFPGVMQPLLDLNNKTATSYDQYIREGLAWFLGMKVSILSFLGTSTPVNRNYYSWNSGGSAMMGGVPSLEGGTGEAYEWSKLMGAGSTNGPVAF
jgi:hypothetical protein